VLNEKFDVVKLVVWMVDPIRFVAVNAPVTILDAVIESNDNDGRSRVDAVSVHVTLFTALKVLVTRVDVVSVLAVSVEILTRSNIELATYSSELSVSVLRTRLFSFKSGVQFCFPLELTVKTYPSLIKEPSGL
jgi:hypothetical protein